MVSLINKIAIYTQCCVAEGKPVSLPLFDMFLNAISQTIRVSINVLMIVVMLTLFHITEITGIM